MKAALLLALLLAVSGCTTTGAALERPEAEPPEPCEVVVCGRIQERCPDGTLVECQEQCSGGLCVPCTVSCVGHEDELAAAPATDLCAPVRCPSLGYCPDGSVAPCASRCDPESGICSVCVPECAAAQAVAAPAPLPTPAAAAPPSVRITAISFKAAGEKEDPNLEWVELSGTGDLSGWTLSDAGTNRYTFPPFALSGSVRVHSGKGTDTGTELYWGRTISVWNNDGDTAILKDASGALVDSRSGP